jgi:hypothetical protein
MTTDVIEEKAAPTTGISGNAIAALIQAIIGQKTQSAAQGTNSSATSGTNVSSGTTSHTGDTAGLEQILQQILDPNNLQNLTASLFAKGAAQVPALTSQYANATGTRVGGNTMLSQSLAELNQTLAQSIAQAVVQQQQTGVQAATGIAQNKSTGTTTGNQQTTGQSAGTENKTGTSTTGPKMGLKSLALPLALGVGVNKLSKVDLGDIWDSVTGAFGGGEALPSTFGEEGALSGDAMGLPFGTAGGPGSSALDAGSSAIGEGSASISDQVFEQLVARMNGEAPVVAGTQVADASGATGTATDAGAEGIGAIDGAADGLGSSVNATNFADSYDGAAFAGANEAVDGAAGASIPWVGLGLAAYDIYNDWRTGDQPAIENWTSPLFRSGQIRFAQDENNPDNSVGVLVDGVTGAPIFQDGANQQFINQDGSVHIYGQ